MIYTRKKSKAEIIILCIGTDRITGDSLGPLLGHLLSEICKPGLLVYGSLEAPVHAGNLRSTLQMLSFRHPGAFVIAIDAALGSSGHIGLVTLNDAPLGPGAAVQKRLPKAGNVSITGIVGALTSTPQASLAGTRLYLVMSIALYIKEGLLLALNSEAPSA